MFKRKTSKILLLLRVNLSIEWRHINIKIVLYTNSIRFFFPETAKAPRQQLKKNNTEHLKFRLCRHFVHTYTLKKLFTTPFLKYISSLYFCICINTLPTYPHLRNKKFLLKFLSQQNASKFSIFHI